MFGRKYVFETRSTRFKRILGNSFIVLSGLLIVFFFLCLFVPYYAYEQNENRSKAFFKKSPDVIALYTGDSGRLEYLFSAVKDHPASKVFISGVYAKNSLKTLLYRQGRNISIDDFLQEEGNNFELDYLARNTVENVLSTFRYLENFKNVKTILIVSSDYHILRIKMVVDRLMSNSKNYQFYYYGVKTNYLSFRSIKLLFKEVYKLFRTSFFLFFYD